MTTTKPFDAYQLKWLAIIGMFLNHLVLSLHPALPYWLQFPLYAVGGLTFPIMAFLVVEGYRHTSNFKRYLLRIFLFGLLAQVPHTIAFGIFALNIMFTIFLSLLLLVLYDKIQRRFLFWLIFVLACIISILFDWGIIGPIMVLMYHCITNENRRRILPSIVGGLFNFIFSLLAIAGFLAMGISFSEMVGVGFYLSEYGGFSLSEYGGMPIFPALTFIIGCFAAAYFIKNYNGERGKPMKYFFYIFYPAHLLVLAILVIILGLR